MGRPTDYTKELGDEICALITEGHSLKSICEKDAFPAIRTIFSWLRIHEQFLHNYEIARENQADTFADEIFHIADSVGKTSEAVQKARLQVDARKWVASKFKPKKYGDKIDLTSAGERIQPILGGMSVSADNSDPEAS